MSKFKVAFNLDLSQIAPEVITEGGEVPTQAVVDVVTTMLLEEARRASKDRLHEVRRDPNMDPEVKVLKMGEQIRHMMITLMAQANMSVEAISDDVEISTELPFERAYAEDQRRYA